MLFKEIKEILSDETGRFKHKILSRITEETGLPYQKVVNIMHQRRVTIDVKDKLRVYEVAEGIANEIMEERKLLSRYE